MMCQLRLIGLFLISFGLFFNGQAQSLLESSDCTQLKNCSKCIQSSLRCKWCTQLRFTGSRCIPQTAISLCNQFFDPKGSQNALKEEEFSDDIQISPQQIDLILRPGIPETFNVTVKPAPNFPLDVYFLMDFSFSMKNDLQTLRGLVSNLARKLREISTDYRIGFGSFVDKETDPFEFQNFFKKKNPCGGNEDCVKSYAFQNHLSLNNNIRNLSIALQHAKLSGNLDRPESGADAILQAIVCKSEIGWRPAPARRLLVFITDDGFHFANDGKLGGVVTPHDGKCHLTMQRSGNYKYTEAERLDYPSISMIAEKLRENVISPIFGIAVFDTKKEDTENSKVLYHKYLNLTSSLPNAAVEKLEKDSSNLLPALRNAYNTISSRITINPFLGELQDIDITIKAHCPNGTSDTLDNDNSCSGVFEGDVVTFEVSVTANRCTQQFKRGVSFPISTGFFGTVNVSLRTICECDCDTEVNENADQCSGFGSLVCGRCDCPAGRFGHTCECGVETNSTEVTVPQCRVINGKVCSGPVAGECVCGVCACNTNVGGNPGHYYFGDNCECNNFQCAKDDKGRFCSGNGKCGCHGICECNKAPSGNLYTGHSCQCYPDNDKCIKPASKDVCSGHGTCICGRCECDYGFAGEFCQDCISHSACGIEICADQQECINCMFTIEYGQIKQQYKETCSQQCYNKTVVMVDDIGSVSNAIQCKSGISNEECSGFMYYLQSKEGVIYVESSPINCFETIPVWIIVAPIAGGLLLLGILMILLVKCVLMCQDYMEYRNWKRDLAKVTFGDFESPLYRSAGQTFYCPLYPGYLEKGLIGALPKIQEKELHKKKEDDATSQSSDSSITELNTQSNILRVPIKVTIPQQRDSFESMSTRSDRLSNEDNIEELIKALSEDTDIHLI